MRRALPVLLLAATACRPDPAVTTVELDRGWELRHPDGSGWIPARVPGTVHTDLLAAGLVPDPFVGTNQDSVQWIEERGWTYRLRWTVDPTLLESERLELGFDGLDTWATVLLNGDTILEADNQFREWRVPVGEALRAGDNELEVRFASPVVRGRAAAAAHPWAIPHQEPDTEGTRAFTRKAAYHFGWDWGPRLVTSGVWRPVRLEGWSGVRIRDVRVAEQRLPTAVEPDGALRLRVEVEATTPGSARIRVSSPEGAFPPVEGTAPVEAGLDTLDVTVTIPDARAWWPHTHGEPHLYRALVEVDGGGRRDRSELRFGLRTVELVTEEDSIGESFRFRVNGRDVFARGANLVPPDHFTPRADSAEWAGLLEDAVAAGMNMVRVWGGGVYPPDVFYDVADALGVLVWQDFMFANSLVPGDSAFAASVAAEAQDQIRRLRNHPSMALWCGNNEIDEGWHNWGWQEAYPENVRPRVWAAYQEIFHELLPRAVEAHDPGRPYWPSSPGLGWGDPASLDRGDSHYWGVWWGLEPFRVYADKLPRFASEFGVQALPAPATVAAFAQPGPETLAHPAMASHQKHPTGYETITGYMERRWPTPPPDSLDAFGYVSQLVQADGVGLALEAHRRAWPRTGGTLYWQLNDTWPVVSWSGRDYYGRWKALHHRARRLFMPTAVLLDAWADTVGAWVVSDTGSVDGHVEIRLVDTFGGEGMVASAMATLAGTDTRRAWASTVADLLPEGMDPERAVVVADWIPEEGEPSRDVALLVPPVELALLDPGVEVLSAETDGSAWKATLTAHAFAYGVRLSVEGTGASFSDNYFHLFPGDTVEVRIQPEEPVTDLAGRLRIRSLADTPRR